MFSFKFHHEFCKKYAGAGSCIKNHKISFLRDEIISESYLRSPNVCPQLSYTILINVKYYFSSFCLSLRQKSGC